MRILLLTWVVLTVGSGCSRERWIAKPSSPAKEVSQLPIPDKSPQPSGLQQSDVPAAEIQSQEPPVVLPRAVPQADLETQKLPISWPQGTAPVGSERQNQDPLNTEQTSKKVQSDLDRIASEAEKKEKAPEVWQRLVDVIAETGQPEESRMGFYVSLSHFSQPDRTQSHIANHISVVGGPRADGSFQFSRVEASWEDWKVTKEGYLDGELFMFLVSRDGNLAKFWRYQLVKKLDATVIKHQGLDFDSSEASQKWQQIKEAWIQRLVQPSVKP